MTCSINPGYYCWLIFKVDPESQFLCFPWGQRDCGAQQASFCPVVDSTGPLEGVDAVGLIAVWWQEVARVTVNVTDIVRIGHVPPH